jgi:hypothetical protein
MHKRYTKVEHIREAIHDALEGLLGRRRLLLDPENLRDALDQEFPGSGGDPEHISDEDLDRFIQRHSKAIQVSWRRSTPGALKSLDDSKASLN